MEEREEQVVSEEEFEQDFLDDDQEVGIIQKIIGWFRRHSWIVPPLVGGVITIVVEGVKYQIRRNEYEDYLYVTSDNDEVCRIPARRMKSVKRQKDKTFRNKK